MQKHGVRPVGETLFSYWQALPDEFRYRDIADKLLPHTTLDRLLVAVRRLGLLTLDQQKIYHKVRKA